MIDFKFIKKNFQKRVIYTLFIFSLIFSLLVTFMNPLKVYKLKLSYPKVEYLNRLADLSPQHEVFEAYKSLFIPMSKNDTGIFQKKFNIYTIDNISEFLPKNYQSFNGNTNLIILRKNESREYYLDIISKHELDKENFIKNLSDQADKKIKEYFNDQYSSLISYIDNQKRIDILKKQSETIYLLLNDYQTICLNKKLPFINNFDNKETIFLKKKLESVSTISAMYLFLKDNNNYLAENNFKFCLDNFFFENKINELLKNIYLNHSKKIELIKNVIHKKKIDMEKYNKIIGFSVESEKYSILYNLVQFLKYFIFIFFILIFLRIAASTFVK
jgi:hypothetical protein